MKILSVEKGPFHEIGYRSSGMEPGKWQCLLPFYRVFVDVMPGDISAFVAMSDLQGREKKGSNRLLGEVVAEELAVLEELGEVPKIDLTILAGDLYDYPDCNKKGGTGDISSVLNAFAAHFPNVVAVLGNHDMLGQAALADNVTVLDGDSCMIKGIIIGGVSGSSSTVDKKIISKISKI